MDVVHKRPFVQTPLLQIGTDRVHLCFPVRITPKADALRFKQGGKAEIGVQLVVLAAQSRLIGHGGHGVHIDPVGKAAVRLQAHQAAKLFPRLLEELLLLILGVAVAQQQQQQIFPVVPHFLQGVDRKARCLKRIGGALLCCRRHLRRQNGLRGGRAAEGGGRRVQGQQGQGHAGGQRPRGDPLSHHICSPSVRV